MDGFISSLVIITKRTYYIQKAIGVDGEGNAELLEHLGDVLYMLDRKEEAIDYWEKALKLDSANESLKKKISTGII